MKLLTVNDLHVTLDDNELLQGVDLVVEQAHIHCIIGPNGAGKSTLASCIMGLAGYRPTSGTITFDGTDITHMSICERAKLGLSLAWQEPARFEGLTIRTFLQAGARDKSEKIVRKALADVALDPDRYLTRKVDKTLSGGERKRIELASILTMQPRLIILDEPDSGIDVQAIKKIFSILHTLKNQGTSILLVTHSEEVLKQADIATLICCGKIVEQNSPRKIGTYFTKKCIPCPSKHYPDGEEVEVAAGE